MILIILNKCSHVLEIHIFADDTNLFYSDTIYNLKVQSRQSETNILLAYGKQIIFKHWEDKLCYIFHPQKKITTLCNGNKN